MSEQGQQHDLTEWSFASKKGYEDPFNEVELDVVVTDAQKRSRKVPAFWAGGRKWRARFAPPAPGNYRYTTVCSDATNDALHGQTGVLEVSPYEGDNPLFRHGPLRVSKNRRHFEHADGTPFFWLGDTWWMGLTKRMRWPKDFQALTTDRVDKGFTVIQIVAGLYPDMPWGDERGANEAGFPWDKDFRRINPTYFDKADRRIQHLVNMGLVPCIVGCWGYFLPWMGVAKMKQHWRYLVARYGAYPVVWCLAGEGSMPYYLSETKDADHALQKREWTEVGRYVQEIDPCDRPVTIHPSSTARDTIEDTGVLDFDMLQTGHSDRESLSNTVKVVTEEYAASPTMPVVNGEVCYEGIGESCRQEVQRLMFWACVLSGACGHTYGANGIWQVNTRQRPYGPSPHGMSWGNTPWEDAAHLPGSRQVGLAKRLLERYEWWRFEPHPEWVEPCGCEDNYFAPYAAGIPGMVRITFWPLRWSLPFVKDLERGLVYHAFLFNPADGSEHDLGVAEADDKGEWHLPKAQPIYQDWVLVLENVKA